MTPSLGIKPEATLVGGKSSHHCATPAPQYKSTTLSPLMIGGTVIDRVQSYKLLGLHISNDLTWNSHCETVYKKAVKRLYGLRVLKKPGMSMGDLVSVYCSIVRSTVEYASPAWAALPQCLSNNVRKCPKTSHASNFSRFSIRRCTRLSRA